METELLKDWKNLNEQINKLKEKELELRSKIFSDITGKQLDTLVNFELDGLRVKAKRPLRLKFDVKRYEEIKKDLSTPEKKAVAMKPCLTKKAFNDLLDKSTLRQAVEIVEGAPELSVEQVIITYPISGKK